MFSGRGAFPFTFGAGDGRPPGESTLLPPPTIVEPGDSSEMSEKHLYQITYQYTASQIVLTVPTFIAEACKHLVGIGVSMRDSAWSDEPERGQDTYCGDFDLQWEMRVARGGAECRPTCERRALRADIWHTSVASTCTTPVSAASLLAPHQRIGRSLVPSFAHSIVSCVHNLMCSFKTKTRHGWRRHTARRPSPA